MNQQPEPVDDDASSLMSKRYERISDALKSLTVAQVDLCLHEVERIIKQLEEIPQKGDGQPRHEQMYVSSQKFGEFAHSCGKAQQGTGER